MKAETNFEKTVQEGNIPEKIEETILDKDTLVNEDLLVKLGLAGSKSEAKRLFEQGGVFADGDRIETGKTVEVVNGMVIKVGKRKFVKIVISS